MEPSPESPEFSFRVWPKIPKIPVDFKPVDGNMVADVVVDLGVLGEYEMGELMSDEAIFNAFTPEEIEDLKTEIQLAFNRLILKLAAVVLVEAGEGYAPLVALYESAQKELT